MKLEIILTANAGVILNFGENEHIYGIDALHNTKGGEFSSLSREQTENVFSLFDRTPPEALLITHSHADHCSPELLERAEERYPGCRIIEPWKEPEKACKKAFKKACKKTGKLYITGEASISAIPLPHRCAPAYPEADNYGFVLSVGGKTVFAPGDAEPLSGEMRKFAENFHPDAALLPFLWVTLPKHRTVLDLLAPENIVFLHLPFEEQDPFGYNRVALSEAARFYPDSTVLNRHMQTAVFDL